MSLPKIGAAIVLDGEKEYKDAIAKVNRSMSEMRSEMKLVTAQFDGQANTIEALRKKHDVLKKEYEAQETKLRTMTGALENAKKQYGDNSKEASDWQIKINNATAELAKLDKELKQNDKYMEEAERSTDGTAKSIDEYGKEVKEADKDTASFGDTAKKAGSVLTGAFAAVATAAVGVVNSTQELREDLGKLETNAKVAGVSIEDANTSLKELNRVSSETDSNIEALSNIMAAGFKDDSMAEAIDLLSGAVIKFPDTMKIESLADSLQETLATGEATGQYAELLERLGVELEDFNDSLSGCRTETERQNLALSTLAQNGLAEIKQSYIDTNSVLVESADAQYDLQMAMANIGEKLAPVVARGMGSIADFANESGEELGELVEGALQKLLDALEFLMDNSDTVKVGLVGIGAGFAALKTINGIQSAIKTFKSLSDAITVTSGATKGLWALMSAHPIGIAVTAVGALTAAVVALAISQKNEQSETEKSIERRNESRREMEAEAVVCQQLVEELKELQAKTSLTADEQSRQTDIISQLNGVMPELNLAIDEQTGLLNMNIEALEGNVEALMALSRAEAAKEALTENASEQVEKQKELNDLLKQQEETEQRLASLKSQSSKSSYGIESRGSQYNTSALIETEKQLRVLNESIANAESSLERLQTEYRETMDYISNQEAIANAASDMASLKTETEETTEAIKLTGDALEEHLDAFSEKMQGLLDEQYDDYEDVLKKQMNALKDSYEERLDLMEKEQKKERKMLEKQQKEELELFEEKYDELLELAEKKYDEEIKAAKKAHDERIAMIDSEFTERMKLADEERYKQVKAAQEQIDEIKRIIEEEELAEQAKTEAKKRAELEKAITQAETIEEKKAAEQELAEFEEKLRQEALSAERAAAIAALEAQIEAYNDEYDEFVDKEENELKKQKETAEEELKAEEERIAAVLQAEKDRIAEELEAEKEAIQERHELQDEELAERYENKRKSLQKEKELAIETEKETNEELLRQFKQLNADKLEEAKAAAEVLYRHNAELVDTLNLDRYVTTAPTSEVTPTHNHVVNNSPVFNTNVSNGADVAFLMHQVNRVLAMEY